MMTSAQLKLLIAIVDEKIEKLRDSADDNLMAIRNKLGSELRLVVDGEEQQRSLLEHRDNLIAYLTKELGNARVTIHCETLSPGQAARVRLGSPVGDAAVHMGGDPSNSCEMTPVRDRYIYPAEFNLIAASYEGPATAERAILEQLVASARNVLGHLPADKPVTLVVTLRGGVMALPSSGDKEPTSPTNYLNLYSLCGFVTPA